jgi:Putative MetA-pathway of phenol degradation
MKIERGQMQPVICTRWIALAMLAVGALGPLEALSQVPARFYWKSLSGGNAVPLIYESISGNTNPFDSANLVIPGANFDATLALTGYAHTFTLAGRSALAAVILPMGRVSGDVLTPGGDTAKQSASGFGDPTLEFNFNLIGPKAQVTIPDALRYEPGFSLDVLADLMIPIGEYDSDQSLNIGQNRWYGRIGFPVVWQLGDWVPGRRTTLEFLPAVWFFGDNTDFVGQTLETDPLFQIDAHLTRDFTGNLWGSLDAAWYNGAEATIGGVKGEELDNYGFGLTLGYQVNDNLGLTFGYKSTASDDEPDDLQMDVFMISLVYGWHPIIEGSKRLKSE